MLGDKEPYQPVLSAQNGFLHAIAVVGVGYSMLADIPRGATGCIINVEGQGADIGNARVLRMRLDGTLPAPGWGVLLGDGAIINLTNLSQMQNAKFQPANGIDVIINVQFFYYSQTS